MHTAKLVLAIIGLLFLIIWIAGINLDEGDSEAGIACRFVYMLCFITLSILELCQQK